MSEMVERVARALMVERFKPDDPGTAGLPWTVFERDARAAIAAMREPTEAMAARGFAEYLAEIHASTINAWEAAQMTAVCWSPDPKFDAWARGGRAATIIAHDITRLWREGENMTVITSDEEDAESVSEMIGRIAGALMDPTVAGNPLGYWDAGHDAAREHNEKMVRVAMALARRALSEVRQPTDEMLNICRLGYDGCDIEPMRRGWQAAIDEVLK